ncbi:hypothetical protein [Mycobacterium sp. URHB0021]
MPDNTALIKEIGHSVSNEDGIADTAEWFRAESQALPANTRSSSAILLSSLKIASPRYNVQSSAPVADRRSVPYDSRSSEKAFRRSLVIGKSSGSSALCHLLSMKGNVTLASATKIIQGTGVPDPRAWSGFCSFAQLKRAVRSKRRAQASAARIELRAMSYMRRRQ